MEFKAAFIKSYNDVKADVVSFTLSEFIQFAQTPALSRCSYNDYHTAKSNEKKYNAKALALKGTGEAELIKEYKEFAKMAKTSVTLAKDGMAIMPYHFKDDRTFYIDDRGQAHRNNDDITAWSLVMLDIEEKISAEEIHEALADYEYVLWPSISYREDDQRFRVVLFPEEPLSTEEAHDIIKGIDARLPQNAADHKPLGAIDPACLDKKGRLMYMPKWLASHPVEYFSVHNDGRLVKAGDFPITDELKPIVSLRAANQVKAIKVRSENLGVVRVTAGDNTLPGDTLFETDDGPVLFKDVTAKISNVSCPVHSDTVGSEFLDINIHSRRPQFYCLSCGLFKLASEEGLKLVKKTKPVPADETFFEDAVVEERDIVKLDERQFFKTKSWVDRSKIVTAFTSNVLRMPSKGQHFCLRTPEGYGKSTMLVQNLLSKGRKVLFACSSWKQVQSKMEDFAEYEPVIAWSLRGLAQSMDIDLVYEPAGYFEMPVLNEDASLEAIMSKLNCSEAEAGEVLDDLRSQVQDSRSDEAELIITTFNTGSFIEGSLNRIVIADDPSTSDLLTHIVNLSSDEPDFVVAKRDIKDVVFGAAHNTVIWTTTEEIVKMLIEHQHPKVVIKDVRESIDTNNNVLIFPTKMTVKALKAVLPGIHQCVMKETKSEQLFIANGCGSEFNLVSTKGRNDLKKDTTIIISHPHPNEVRSVCASLDLDGSDQDEIMKQMLVDVMDQGIGRGQGYRGGQAQTLVICHERLLVSLQARSRYKLLRLEGLKRQKRLNGVPIVWADKTPEWWSTWFAYLNTWQMYVVKFGDEYFNTLPFNNVRLELSKPDVERLEKMLDKPTDFCKATWVMLEQTLEEDGSRKNVSISLSKLVSDYNQHGNKVVEKKPRISKSKSGQKWFCFENQRKRYVPGSEPDGWIQEPARTRKSK